MLTHLFTTYPSGSPSHYMLSHVHACLFTTCPSGSPSLLLHVQCMLLHVHACLFTAYPVFVHVRPLYWHTCMYNVCISSLFTTGTCMYTVWSYQDSQPLPFLCALHVGTHACTCTCMCVLGAGWTIPARSSVTVCVLVQLQLTFCDRCLHVHGTAACACTCSMQYACGGDFPSTKLGANVVRITLLLYKHDRVKLQYAYQQLLINCIIQTQQSSKVQQLHVHVVQPFATCCAIILLKFNNKCVYQQLVASLKVQEGCPQ